MEAMQQEFRKLHQRLDELNRRLDELTETMRAIARRSAATQGRARLVAEPQLSRRLRPPARPGGPSSRTVHHAQASPFFLVPHRATSMPMAWAMAALANSARSASSADLA